MRLYSCFRPDGSYQYYETQDVLPINADLPVPSFPVTTQIGVPSIDAARPMPPGAKFVGTGWQARGTIVRCPESFGLGVIEFSGGAQVVMMTLLAAGAGFGVAEVLGKNGKLGAALGAAAGLLGAIVGGKAGL